MDTTRLMADSTDKALADMGPEELFHLAMRLHRDGQLLEAREIYVKLHEFAPEHPDVLNFLGVVDFQLGHRAEAIERLREALRLAPEHVDALNNLGNMLAAGKSWKEAEDVLQDVIRLQPEHIDARNNLGVVLKNQGKLDEAVHQFRMVIEKDGSRADALHNLANVLERQHRYDEASVAARGALQLQSKNTRYFENLSRTLRKAGQFEEAAKIVRQWLRWDPDSVVAQHHLHALSGDQLPPSAPPAYVQQTYDEFAAHFEEVLESLEYRVPELVGKLLESLVQEPQHQYRIVDLGCGTGLCQPFLGPYARRLVGLDLSSEMIAQARRRGGYDELIHQELTQYLDGTAEEFDIMAAADTLIYIGDLRNVFKSVARRLAPDGLFVFSAELAESDQAVESGSGYVLQPTGRYAHTETYLQQQAQAVGLKTVRAESATVRKECSEPVSGLLMAVRRTS